MKDPALTDGVVRTTIEAESLETARRAAWAALGEAWEATGRVETSVDSAGGALRGADVSDAAEPLIIAAWFAMQLAV